MYSSTGPDIPQARRLVTAIPGPRSLELARRREQAVAAAVRSALPVYADRAGGGVIIDVDGNSLIDLASGIAVTSVGVSAPLVVEAVAAQAHLLTHTCFMVVPYQAYVDVCAELNALTPGDHDKRSALFNSGAEAVENAVKIARHHTGRHAVVALEHAYHGRTNLTLALTAKNMPYKHSFGPFAPEVYRVPNSYPLRDGDGADGRRAAARGIARLESELGAENIAAIIVEPIQGEGGFVVPAPGFLTELATWAQDRGVIFIADEIQTGFCRTGDWFACEYEGVVPDLITTAKGIAGGLPLAAVTGRAELLDGVHSGGLGGTYGGNPVACAAALGTIRTMRELELATRARQIGEVITQRLAELQAACPSVAEVRGRGAMMALELARPGTLEPLPDAAREVATRCAGQGVVVLTAGTYGNVVRLLPPLVIDFELLREGLEVLCEAVQQVCTDAA